MMIRTRSVWDSAPDFGIAVGSGGNVADGCAPARGQATVGTRDAVSDRFQGGY